MPALPPVPNVFRLTFQHTYGPNTRVFNHKYFKYSGTLNTADAQTLCNTAATKWIADVLQGGLSNQLSLVQTVLTDLNSLSGPVVTSGTSGAGANVGAAEGAGLAYVVEMKIARRFRGGHARLYLCGVTTTGLATLDTVAPSIITGLQNGLAQFDTDMATTPPAAVGTITSVTVSYFKGFTVSAPVGKRAKNIPTLNPTGPVVDNIIGYKCNTHVASQRRRNQQSL